MQPNDCDQPVPDTDSLYIALQGGVIVKALQMLNHHTSLKQWHLIITKADSAENRGKKGLWAVEVGHKFDLL